MREWPYREPLDVEAEVAVDQGIAVGTERGGLAEVGRGVGLSTRASAVGTKIRLPELTGVAVGVAVAVIVGVTVAGVVRVTLFELPDTFPAVS